MTAIHEQALAHQKGIAAEEQSRREASQWRPSARLIPNPKTLSNTLQLTSSKPMSLERVELLTASGVLVSSVPGSGDTGNMAHGLDFAIPAAAILKLVSPDPDYQRNQKTTGRLRYVLNVGILSTSQAFELPFRVIQDITNNTVWNRMEG